MEHISGLVPASVWIRIYSFLPRRDYGNFALTCKNLEGCSRVSSCLDFIPVNFPDKSPSVSQWVCLREYTSLTKDVFHDRLRSIELYNSGEFINFDPEIFPPWTERIIFSGISIRTIAEGKSFPPFVQELDLGLTFTGPLHKNVLPQGLKKLRLGDLFNSEFSPNSLPPNLTHLYIYGCFNKDLENLPDSLRVLKIDSVFNKQIRIGQLPPNLEVLEFGRDFNSTIEVGALPSSLKKLVFGRNFNREITPGLLPKNLEYLSFGNRFDKPIQSESLPPTLKYLKFGFSFSSVLSGNDLPESLEVLKFGQNCPGISDPIHLKSLIKIRIGNKFNTHLSSTNFPNLKIISCPYFHPIPRGISQEITDQCTIKNF